MVLLKFYRKILVSFGQIWNFKISDSAMANVKKGQYCSKPVTEGLFVEYLIVK